MKKKFPIISQMPELPTGCEITALAMMLNFYGFKVDKETLAYQYLPTVPAEIQYGVGRERSWSSCNWL